MERKVGLRSGQRPVGYHASREGLDELKDAHRNAKQARRATGTSFRSRLNKVNQDDSTEEEDVSEDSSLEQERVTFHPGGPSSRVLKPGERWRLKG
jgi:hypothetical protein